MRMTTLTIFLFAVLGAMPCSAQMMVDQADSLNFQEFHEKKEDAIKVWKDNNGDTQVGKKTTPIKTYDQTPANATAPAKDIKPAAPSEHTSGLVGVSGQRYEIRDRYTLGRSASTPYSAFYVIEGLHQQSASICRKGWKKIGERSEPVEQDFYLYYEIECL